MRVVSSIAAALLAAMLVVSSASGAAPGARLIRDIHPSGGSDPRLLTRVGQVVYFSASDGVRGRELWRTDGSTRGTRLVRDIRPGLAGSQPQDLARVGNRLFFTANDGVHGRELWVSDGTKAGTRLVRDLTGGPKGSSQMTILDRGGRALFSRDFRDLWRSDGTAGGTLLLRRFTGINLADTASLKGALHFPADDAIWKTDGTAPGTRFVVATAGPASELTTYKSRLYFSTFGYPQVPRLWWSDGSAAGTRRLAGIVAPRDLTILDRTLLFNAATSTTASPRLFRGDGTVSGTIPVQPRVRPLVGMVKALGRLWAVDASLQAPWHDRLWSSDGTAAGTSLVHGGTGEWFTTDDEALELVSIGGRIWFAAGPGALVDDEWSLTDHELWSSDGTTSGTFQATDIDPAGSSKPRYLTTLASSVVFGATDGSVGRELWAIDVP
jgi:ELWxxDGT repeat protein